MTGGGGAGMGSSDLAAAANGSTGNKSNSNEGPDFRALAMESESLLSHIARPDGIPRVHKSLAEIVSVPNREPTAACPSCVA